MSAASFVLLWGVPGDAPLSLVHRTLVAANCPVVLLDQWKVEATQVDLHTGPEGPDDIRGLLRIGPETCNLSDVRSVYLRAYDHADLPIIARAGPTSALAQHAATVEDRLMTWAALSNVLVVNPLRAMAANGSKPMQSAWIASHGFAVPDTLVTTDAEAALAFWQEHGEVVYKSISGTRSIVSRLRPEHRERLAQVAACPTQFQQYIPGTEYRAHVVGDRVFACRILSDADDYRYATTAVQVDPWPLPADIADRCRTMAAAMELPLAGIDLRCTPDERWYCLEVNPSPGFSYFDVHTGPSIAEAVADLLASANPDSGGASKLVY